MKEYVITKLDDNKYGVLLLCLSHDNIFFYVEEIQKESLLQEDGILLLDQLLVTGNNDNRYVELPYSKGRINFSKGKKVSVNSRLQQVSIDILNLNKKLLKTSILTELQKIQIENKQILKL